MLADLCRRAAAGMRELAEGSRREHPTAVGRWEAEYHNDEYQERHMAAWDPAAALAVAEWLESHAEWVAEHELHGIECPHFDPETDPGVELARRFLREEGDDA